MKKFFLLLAASAMLIGCTNKPATTSTTATENTNSGGKSKVMLYLYDNFVLRRRDIILSFLALYYNEAVLGKCLYSLQLSFNWDCLYGRLLSTVCFIVNWLDVPIHMY